MIKGPAKRTAEAVRTIDTTGDAGTSNWTSQAFFSLEYSCAIHSPYMFESKNKWLVP